MKNKMIKTLLLLLAFVSVSVLGQDAKTKKTEQAIALDSISLEPLFPSLTEFPRYDGMKWRTFRGGLASEVISEKSRTVKSGKYYAGYIKMRDQVLEMEEYLADIRRRYENAPGEYAEKMASCEASIKSLESYVETYKDRPRAQEKYIKRLEEKRKRYEKEQAYYPDHFKSLKSSVKYCEKTLAKYRAESPAERAQNNLVSSGALFVMGGIIYVENPDGWLEAMKKNDPLFKEANSAGVGDFSIKSSKITDLVYNVRFKRGHYIVALNISWGSAGGKQISKETKEEKGLNIQVIGKRIAQLYDRHLIGVQGISIEKNPTTEVPYTGLVADGKTTLELSVYLPDVSDFKVTPPAFGTLFAELDGIETPLENENIPLSDGRARLFYRPPDYLEEKELKAGTSLKSTIVLKGNKTVEKSGKIFYANVPLVFTWKDKDGNEQKSEIPIQTCRPPVFLVHGFTGSLATWKRLDEEMSKQKWHTHRGEYYYGKQNIADQAVLLRKNIQAMRGQYEKLGFKAKKIDIVAHSMGGLISRQYISVSGTYDDDVHKLIMVATPNHGSLAGDKLLGELVATIHGHAIANTDLYCKSNFMQHLNDGEAYGKHLTPGVQYALLYGRRRGQSPVPAWDHLMAYDDGVVTVDSALLNGVIAYRFDRCIHSTAGLLMKTYPNNIAVPENKEIWHRVKLCLLGNIPQKKLRNPKALVTAVQGKVTRSAGLRRQFQIPKGMDVQSYLLTTSEDGSCTINLIADNETWGVITVYKNTQILFYNVSMESARLYIYAGSVDFYFAKGKKKFCQVAVGDKPQRVMDFKPLMNVYHLDTEFTVSRSGDKVDVTSKEGRLVVEYLDSDGKTTQMLIPSGGATQINLAPGKKVLSETPEKQPKPPVVTPPVTPPKHPVTPQVVNPPVTPPSAPNTGGSSGTPSAESVTLGKVTPFVDAVEVGINYKDLPTGSLLSVEIGGSAGVPPRQGSMVVSGSGKQSCRISAPLMGWNKDVQPVRIRLGKKIIFESTIKTKTQR